MPSSSVSTASSAECNPVHLPWDGPPRGWGGSTYHETRGGSTRTPVVLVHGNRSTADAWQPHAADLLETGARGDDVWAIEFTPETPSHEQMAAQLEAFVSKVCSHTGSDSVDIVAHSLGVTGVRWWMSTRDRTDRVRRFVGVAGANHGLKAATLAARFGIDRGVFGPAQFLRDDYQRFSSHPLQTLNEPRDVPSEVRAFTLFGKRDRLFTGARYSPVLTDAEQNIALPTGHLGSKNSTRARRLIRTMLTEPESV